MGTGETEYWERSSRFLSSAHRFFITWFWRISVIGSLIMLPLSGTHTIRLSSYLILAAIGVYSLWQINKGRYKTPSVLAVYTPFILISATLIASGTMMIPAVSALPIIIICGNWLLGRRTALLLITSSIALVFGLGAYASLGGQPITTPPAPIIYAATLAFYFFFAWSLGRLSEQSYAERTRQVEAYAFHDQLTGLPNRNLFLDRVAQEIQECLTHQHLAAFIILDIKKFQLINSSVGHKAGDLLLKQIAERLLRNESQLGSVARLSDDVFALLCRNVGSTKAEAVASVEVVAKRIFELFDQHFVIDSVIQHCDVAVGASVFGDTPTTPSQLLNEAELATRESKKEIGHTFNFYDRTLQELATQRAATEESLRQAIEQNQFELFYQPQFSESHLVGVEALIRWRHPRRGLVPPGEFIPVAEESGLVVAMGKWVLQEACRQIVKWQPHPLLSKITIAVNVSAAQIALPDFTKQVLATVIESGIPPQALKLELTESAFVQDADLVVEKMRALREAGIRFSLDDFGTGYSSLSYLKRLPLDQLKIDQIFVRDLLSNNDDATIARTIINLAREFGLDVIAEGVETEAQRDFLTRYGCPSFQGYLYSKPLPVVELESYAAALLHATDNCAPSHSNTPEATSPVSRA